MDFFDSMLWANGDPAMAAGIYSATQKEQKKKRHRLHIGPPPVGITVPENSVALYNEYDKFIGFASVENK